jgi:hypothetical protein
MTVGELRDLLAGKDPSMPVVIWNDNDGSRGEVEYTTDTDGEVTICGRMT